MSGETRTGMQQRLAREFEARGWDYDLTTVPDLLDAVAKAGEVNPERLADGVSADFLTRTGATRADIADAIRRAIGGRTVAPDESARGVTIAMTINNNQHSVNLGPGATMTGGTINTGTQIAIQASSQKSEVLIAVAALVVAGLQGEWSPDAAADLAQLIDGRDDIDFEDVREATLGAAREAGADTGKVKALLTDITTSAISGALSTGIVAGLGALF